MAKAKSRLKMTNEQKAESLAKDRTRKAEETALMTDTEKKARAKQIKIAMAKSRLK